MLNKNDRKAGTLYRIIWKINGGGGEKKSWKGTTDSQGVFSIFSRMHFPFGAAPGGQSRFAQALQQTQPPCRSK